MNDDRKSIEYSEQLETVDWRFSAAVVGIIKYLNYFGFDYNKIDIEANDSNKEWDVLKFNKEDITEERYLEFVEYYYHSDMHHKVVEDMLMKDEFDDGLIKDVNSKLTANSVMKKIFNKMKFDGTNKDVLLRCIEDNRLELIKETYRNKNNLYKNFSNSNQLFNENQIYCRLNGYYIDGAKKGKSISYNFNTATYVSEDIQYFDFIPFAFTIGRESFFINDNFSIKDLTNSNQHLIKSIEKDLDFNKKGMPDVRKVFFKAVIESAEFIDYDVEVIIKNIDNSHFETLFLRKDSIEIFKRITSFNTFCFSFKVNDNYFINVQKRVTDSIINVVVLDGLVEHFLKEDNKYDSTNKYNYLITQLLITNSLIRNCLKKQNKKYTDNLNGGVEMNKSMKVAYACAKQVVETFEKRKQLNKISSYRTKLTSALVFKDYNRFCDILIQLANYSDVQLEFAYALFEDFEDNKDVAYTFINALTNKKVLDTNDKSMEGDNIL